MFSFFSRSIVTLCVAVLLTAVNGGVLALASNLDGAKPAPGTSMLVAQMTIQTTILAADADQLSANDLDDRFEARQSAPRCKAGSSDCGGPVPTVDTVAGGSTDLWTSHAVRAHRDYPGEHQLRPPRI